MSKNSIVVKPIVDINPPVTTPSFFKHKGTIISTSQILSIRMIKPFQDKYDKRIVYTHLMLVRGAVNIDGEATIDRIFLMEGAAAKIEKLLTVVDVTPEWVPMAGKTIAAPPGSQAAQPKAAWHSTKEDWVDPEADEDTPPF